MKKSLALMMLLLLMLTTVGCMNGIGIPTKTGDVFGVVVDSNNQPLVDALVTIYGEQLYTDANGAFEMYGLPVAKHTIVVEHEYKEVVREEVQINEGINNLTFTVQILTLSGQVYDTTGAPCYDAYVYIYTEQSEYLTSATVDSNTGQYSVTLTPGNYEIHAKAYYGSTSISKITLTESMTKNLYAWASDLPTVGDSEPQDLQWPQVTIGKDVYYQVSVSKVASYGKNENAFEEHFYEKTTNIASLEGLSPNATYSFVYRVIDVMTNEVILEGVEWSKINEPELPTFEENSEILINELGNLVNTFWDYYGSDEFTQLLSNMISDTYTDNLGRTKTDLLNELYEKGMDSTTLLLADITVTPGLDGQSATVNCIWQEHNWYYGLLASYPVSFTVANGGTLKITGGTF